MKPYKGSKSSMVFHLPRRIAAVIPPNAHFEAELTDEGVLYRFVGYERPSALRVEEPPTWARNGAGTDA